jgi:hypothetical protein
VRADEGEQLQQNQLIEQVVLEPEDQLVPRVVPCDQLSPQAHVVPGVGSGRRPCVVPSPHLDQRLVVDAARHRPVVQRIRPDGHHAGNAGALECGRRRRAVGDVQPARGV